MLRLYADPDRLAQRLPTLRLLTRSESDLEALGRRLLPHVRAVAAGLVGRGGGVPKPDRQRLPAGRSAAQPVPCDRPARPRPQGGGALARLAAAFRALPIPVIGRLENGRLKLDLRCLEDEAAFVAQLPELRGPAMPGQP